MGPNLYASVSNTCSKLVTRSYSTSFSLGIRCLAKRFHNPIYAIYGFVRIADEIVDSFTDNDQKKLLERFEEDTYRAIEDGVSSNPILDAFQRTVHEYHIEMWTIERFLESMRMDLYQKEHDRASFSEYVLGSAEVVGLMCLRVFTDKDEERYRELEPYARALGAAFQKVNFLRDLKEDRDELGRHYFPHGSSMTLIPEQKRKIEQEIEEDLSQAYLGIVRLPKGASFGVYVAYVYYRELFRKIKRSSPERIEKERIRIPNLQKGMLFLSSYFRYRMSSL